MKYTLRKQFLWLLWLLFFSLWCGSISLYAQAIQGLGESGDVLSTELIRLTLPKNYESSLGLRRYNPPHEAYPNTAIVLLNTPTAKPAEKKVLGVVYLNRFSDEETAILSKPVWDADKKNLYLVVTNLKQTIVRLRVFRVNQQTPLNYPLLFDPQDFRKWPAELPLLSELDADLFSKGGCPVKNLTATATGSTLHLKVDWLEPRCISSTFEYYAERNQWSGDPLSTATYRLGAKTGNLTLFRAEISPILSVTPSGSGVSARKTALPNWIYFLADVATSPSAPPRIVWLAYDSALSLFPRDHLTGNIVWDVAAETAYVVTVKTNSGGSMLRLFKVEMDQNVMPFPISLAVDDVEKWPVGGTALAELNINAYCIKAITTNVAGGILTIVLGCEGTKVQYDLKNKRWLSSAPSAPKAP